MVKICKIIFAFALFILVPFSAEAASLSFYPVSDSRNVGSVFSVNVIVASTAQAMNAASGIVSFPSDKMEVISISKAGSIFSLWAVEPSFSNSAGTVSFEGVILNPGYTGASGRLLTITFRAKREGVANLSFSSGAVLANDGLGTNILADLRTAVFNITDTPIVPRQPVTEREPITEMPENTPVIQSSTHPDQTKWYASNTPKFSWNLPDGALEVRTIIGRSPTIIPTIAYTPAISERVVPELQDGTYYFALRIRTSAGWGAISRYRINIDTTPPKPFSIRFPYGDTGLEPRMRVLFNTTDDRSGISHYNAQIGSDTKLIKYAPQAANDPYILPVQFPGTYTLLVTAFDNAGNVRKSSAEFTIEAISSPTITYYPDTLEERDVINIRGTTYPNSDVTIFIREGDILVSEESVRSNALGDFALIVTKQLDSGVYTFTARVKDGRGAHSMETLPFTISIRPAFINETINFVLKYLSVAVLVIISLGALIWISARLWFKIVGAIKRMRREAREAEMVAERAFSVLHNGVSRHIEQLKKVNRKLTNEEIMFLEEFEERLDEAEKIVTKEIRDISQT